MACWSVVGSPLGILPSPSSRFCPLAPLLLQQLAPYCLLVLPDPPSPPRLRPVVVSHYIRAWCPTPWIDVITGATVRLWLQMSAHKSSGFLSSRRSLIGPPGPCRAFAINPFFCLLGSLTKGLGLSPVRLYELFPYVSEVFLSSVLGEGDFSYGFGVFDFSHEEVKRAGVLD